MDTNEKPLFKYIEVKKYENGEVVKRMDVTSHSERGIIRIEGGLNINLNHEEYYTFSYESETELETI